MNNDCPILPSRGWKTKIFFQPIAGSARLNRLAVKGETNVANPAHATSPCPRSSTQRRLMHSCGARGQPWC